MPSFAAISPVHAQNVVAGWSLILGNFATGALLGLGFAKEDFLGGYPSFRRRLLRLGHIAFAALGMLNLLYGLCPLPEGHPQVETWAGRLLIAGALAMPLVCFLSAWRKPFRHLFFIPVCLLCSAVGSILFILMS